ASAATGSAPPTPGPPLSVGGHARRSTATPPRNRSGAPNAQYTAHATPQAKTAISAAPVTAMSRRVTRPALPKPRRASAPPHSVMSRPQRLDESPRRPSAHEKPADGAPRT